MKTFLHYCLTALITSAFAITISAQVPSITGFSPTSGPVGTTVTIINFFLKHDYEKEFYPALFYPDYYKGI
jgi:hypothetical protein